VYEIKHLYILYHLFRFAFVSTVKIILVVFKQLMFSNQVFYIH